MIRDSDTGVSCEFSKISKSTLFTELLLKDCYGDCFLRKMAYQSGQRHFNSREKLVEAKAIKIKKDCMATWKFKCATKIDHTVQEKIFLGFCKLNQNEKHAFIKQTTVRASANSETNKRKKNSSTYFLLQGEHSRCVCKYFCLYTLAISQKMVYNVYEKADKVTGIMKPDG